MLLQSFFQTTEFYIILLLVAGAVVALVARPKSTMPVQEILMASTLVEGLRGESPWIEVRCDDEGHIAIMRHGLMGISMSGAVSAKVTIQGFNITIKERTVDGNPCDPGAADALFILEPLAPERYYIRYESDDLQLAASLSLRNIPGNSASRPLTR